VSIRPRLIRENIHSEPRVITCGDWNTYLFGKAVYPPGGRFGTRLQNDYQLFILISGGLHLKVERTSYELAPGDAILLRPGRREFFRFSDQSESEHSWCHMAPSLLSRQDKQLLNSAVGVRKAPSVSHLLIEEGLSSRTHDETYLHEAMQALARACLLRFAAEARLIERRNASTPIHPALEKALGIAARSYAELRSAEDLARQVGMSVTQLRSLCRQFKRESPSGMIWRLKAEHAIQMIRSTGLTVGEIAESCGYANPFHLSRSVKRYTGVSPRSLRQGEWNR